MWHIVILLPILGIAVFFFLPLEISIPLYLVILVLSGLMYLLLYDAMKRRPQAGKEDLIGSKGRVVAAPAPEGRAEYTVEAQGTLFDANSPDPLGKGDTVTVTAVEGLTLTVKRAEKKA